MDEDVVDYYLDLADHLGKAARFQLLGALFAGMKIPGLEPTVPAIEGRMGNHTYYSFAIEPERLLKMGYILHRNRANSNLMPTYQRLIKKTRLKRVSQFVESGGFFPNSIILNIESGRRRRLRFEPVGKSHGVARLGVLHLPQTYRAAYVIDGQHRLYGYADSARAGTDLIPVVAFVDMPRAEQVRVFMQINENQQAVPKNLRNNRPAACLERRSISSTAWWIRSPRPGDGSGGDVERLLGRAGEPLSALPDVVAPLFTIQHDGSCESRWSAAGRAEIWDN